MIFMPYNSSTPYNCLFKVQAARLTLKQRLETAHRPLIYHYADQSLWISPSSNRVNVKPLCFWMHLNGTSSQCFWIHRKGAPT